MRSVDINVKKCSKGNRPNKKGEKNRSLRNALDSCL